jgi:hypothetical protein
MKTKHGFRFISAISKEYASILHESWIDWADKIKPKSSDRGKNITYHTEIGPITVSHATGRIVIDTNADEKSVKKFMRPWLSKSEFKTFESNLFLREIGFHFRKFHGTVGFTLNVLKTGKIPFWVSVRNCNNYTDVHFKFNNSSAKIETLSKKEYRQTPTAPPSRKYKSDIELVEFLKQKKIVIPYKHAQEIGLSPSELHRRMHKLATLYPYKVKKSSSYPAAYTYE